MNTKAESIERQLAQHEQVELIGNSTKAEIVGALEEELGYRLNPRLMHLIDVIPDPWLEGVFALRFRSPDGDEPDYFLLTPDGLEQVEFTCWPPKSM